VSRHACAACLHRNKNEPAACAPALGKPRLCHALQSRATRPARCCGACGHSASRRHGHAAQLHAQGERHVWSVRIAQHSCMCRVSGVCGMCGAACLHCLRGPCAQRTAAPNGLPRQRTDCPSQRRVAFCAGFSIPRWCSRLLRTQLPMHALEACVRDARLSGVVLRGRWYVLVCLRWEGSVRELAHACSGRTLPVPVAVVSATQP
jgi:hypothetical protein